MAESNVSKLMRFEGALREIVEDETLGAAEMREIAREALNG